MAQPVGRTEAAYCSVPRRADSDPYVVETSLSPGLLQTPEYTETVIRLHNPPPGRRRAHQRRAVRPVRNPRLPGASRDGRRLRRQPHEHRLLRAAGQLSQMQHFWTSRRKSTQRIQGRLLGPEFRAS
ncbi:Scr1 family TA system antitoxin-like transcriptional regulator [Streptomyces sp. NBC_00056]|uniref:Scr1 family TA system antitoxin-like transcriptional regulator n=1 Tax=Streptomyces sp. NBC_00056 TaxID=2975633 RepID=UPI003868B6A8